MPCMSSGLVSGRTKITASPLEARSSAWSDEKATLPAAAPGEAGNPLTNTWRWAFGSSRGCSNCSKASGLTLLTAVCLSRTPSLTMSTAI